MKRIKLVSLAAIVLLAIYGARQLLPEPVETVDVFYKTDFETTPYGVVGFDSFNAKSARDLMDGAGDLVDVLAACGGRSLFSSMTGLASLWRRLLRLKMV